MKKTVSIISLILMCLVALGIVFSPIKASAAGEGMAIEAESNTNDVTITKSLAVALVVGVTASAGAIGMAIAIFKSVEGAARQPEASKQIQTMMMLGLVFLETAIIYALLAAIFIIFVIK